MHKKNRRHWGPKTWVKKFIEGNGGTIDFVLEYVCMAWKQGGSDFCGLRNPANLGSLESNLS